MAEKTRQRDERSGDRLYRNDDGHFIDVTDTAGVGHTASAMGVAAADYDGDGWTDIFFTTFGAPDVLYRNRGDGTFEDVSDDVGVADAGRLAIHAGPIAAPLVLPLEGPPMAEVTDALARLTPRHANAHRVGLGGALTVLWPQLGPPDQLRAYRLQPKSTWVAANMFELQTQTAQWLDARVTCDDLKRRKLINTDEVKRRDIMKDMSMMEPRIDMARKAWR